MELESKLEKTQTGIAGEFYAAAELARRNYNVSLTFGNTKAIDLLVEKNGTNYSVQVKAIQSKKSICWNISSTKINDDYKYILILLNADDLKTHPEFFPISGFLLKQLIKPAKSGRDYIDYNYVKKMGLEANWHVFDAKFDKAPDLNADRLENLLEALNRLHPEQSDQLVTQYQEMVGDFTDFGLDWMSWWKSR